MPGPRPPLYPGRFHSLTRHVSYSHPLFLLTDMANPRGAQPFLNLLNSRKSQSEAATFSHVLVPLCIQQHLQWASIRRQVLLQLFGINTSTQHKFLPSPNSQARRGRQTISIINKLYCLSEGTKQPPKNPRAWEVEGRVSRSTGGRGVAITNRTVRWASHREGDA